MSIQLKPILAVLCLTGLVTLPAVAASADDANRSQIEHMEKQLASLQKEVQSLKAQSKVRYKHGKKSHHNNSTGQTNVAAASESDDYDERSAGMPLSAKQLVKMISEQREYLPFDLDVPGQAFVSTGPYVGVPIQYSGSNLIVNSPSVNTDVQLLGIRKSIHTQLMAMGGEIAKEPYHSHLLLSGVVEGLGNYTNTGGSPSTTNLDVPNIALDAFFLGPSEWILGFIEFSYDNSSPVNNKVFTSTSNYTTSNSRVYVNKAFATFGDLSESPFYASFGQFYVPYGVYSSVMVSSTFTSTLGRTKARSLLAGFQQQADNAVYGSAFIFPGDSHAASVSKINNGGINIGYKYVYGLFNGNWGASLISNIADSGGMQIGNGFNSFEQISHNVPGFNLRGVFGIGHKIDLIGEFVSATKEFNASDMSFNNHGAKPWALDAEAAYTFTILCDRPSTLAVGYEKSNEALSLGLPLTRYSLVMTTSLLRNTLQSIEFRHDRAYAASDVANGPTGAASTPGACTSSACTATGKGTNAVTATFNYYF